MLASTQTVSVPARDYDRWGIWSIEIANRPDNTLDVSLVIRRASADHWSDRPEDTVFLRVPNVVSALDSGALATLGAVQGGLLDLAGVLMDRDGVR